MCVGCVFVVIGCVTYAPREAYVTLAELLVRISHRSSTLDTDHRPPSPLLHHHRLLLLLLFISRTRSTTSHTHQLPSEQRRCASERGSEKLKTRKRESRQRNQTRGSGAWVGIFHPTPGELSVPPALSVRSLVGLSPPLHSCCAQQQQVEPAEPLATRAHTHSLSPSRAHSCSLCVVLSLGHSLLLLPLLLSGSSLSSLLLGM